MRTKIEAFIAPRPAAAPRSAALEPSGLKGAEPVRQISATDRLKLTDTARLLAGVEQRARDAPPIDQVRVDAVRLAIDEGRYEVRGSAIAEAMLQLEQDLNVAGYERA